MISESIYGSCDSTFKPTYLYIKQHRKTGMLYLGITVRNVEKYIGSGLYWKRHVKEHGRDIDTVWYCLFLDYESLNEAALLLSQTMDIVKSEKWANLTEETGTKPGMTKEKYREWVKNKTAEELSEIYSKKANIGVKNGMYGVHRHGTLNPRHGAAVAESTRKLISAANKNYCVMKNSQGEYVRVHKENTETDLTPVNKNKIVVRTKTGELISIGVDDPRYISGEFVHVNHGKTRSDSEKEHLSKIFSSLKWYNNGKISIRRAEHPGDGWVSGRIKVA